MTVDSGSRWLDILINGNKNLDIYFFIKIIYLFYLNIFEDNNGDTKIWSYPHGIHASTDNCNYWCCPWKERSS